ncbi:hypothetical protein BC834DRAFT_875540 [Gloeopeniophorella convolvens]|nr:hypothetical protein BC834DRAFT_875540 [Gloeopeniophorella convolvens]
MPGALVLVSSFPRAPRQQALVARPRSPRWASTSPPHVHLMCIVQAHDQGVGTASPRVHIKSGA